MFHNRVKYKKLQNKNESRLRLKVYREKHMVIRECRQAFPYFFYDKVAVDNI